MAQQLWRQHKLNLGTDFWLSVILGFILIILNAAFYFQAPLARFIGLDALYNEDWAWLLLLYFLFIFFGFFLIGLLMGRVIWNASAATRFSVTAGTIGILPVIVVSVVIGMIGGGLDYFADGIYLAPVIGCSEILVSIVGVRLGRVIEGRFLHRQPRPDWVMPDLKRSPSD